MSLAKQDEALTLWVRQWDNVIPAAAVRWVPHKSGD